MMTDIPEDQDEDDNVRELAAKVLFDEAIFWVDLGDITFANPRDSVDAVIDVLLRHGWAPRARCEAAVAEAVAAERERCAKVAEEWEDKGDRKFDDCIKRSREGQANLELAAAACAGMSHQARRIAAAIRKGP